MMSLPLLGYVKGDYSSDLEEERAKKIKSYTHNI